MSAACTYTARGTTPCPAAATHRVVRGWLRPDTRWRIEEVGEVLPAMELAADGLIVGRTSHQPPEFCLRHAGDVMDQRNALRRERV